MEGVRKSFNFRNVIMYTSFTMWDGRGWVEVYGRLLSLKSQPSWASKMANVTFIVPLCTLSRSYWHILPTVNKERNKRLHTYGPKRTIFGSGDLWLLQMVSKLNMNGVLEDALVESKWSLDWSESPFNWLEFVTESY